MTKKKCMIIESHSDDSAISISGFLDKYRDVYDYTFLLLTASTLNMNHCGKVSIETRLEEYNNYVKYFDGKWYRESPCDEELPLDFESHLYDFPRNFLVKILETAIRDERPDVLICQGPSFHHDHTLTYEAVIAATRPSLEFCPKEIYITENPTYYHSLGPSTDFKPDTYIELSENQIEKKVDMIEKVFKSQITPSHNCLSRDGIKTWARYRGIESNCIYAEALRTYSRVI